MLREFCTSVFLKISCVFQISRYYNFIKISLSSRALIIINISASRDLKMTFACLLVFVSSFSRIWPSANICLAAKVNSRVFLSRTFAHFSTAARHRTGTFSQWTSDPNSFRQRDSISALHLEKILARHLGYRRSDDRNADHNERLHHVGDRSHFGTCRTSSSFGPSRSSLTHLRRRERTGRHASFKRQQSCPVDARGGS